MRKYRITLSYEVAAPSLGAVLSALDANPESTRLRITVGRGYNSHEPIEVGVRAASQVAS